MRERLLSFIDALRQSGVRVSVAESLDAMNAVAAAGLARSPMREALAATLVKDEDDRAIFDQTFERLFPPRIGAGMRRSDPPRGEQPSPSGGKAHGRPISEGSAPPDLRKLEKPSSGDLAEAAEPNDSSPHGESEAGDEHAAESGEPRERSQESSPIEDAAGSRLNGEHRGNPRAALRAIERKPFAEYSDLDLDAARDALAPLARRFRMRLGRRMRVARRGRIDFRRTIRAATQRGGTLIDLRFRARRPRHVDLLILADISGSVRYASQLMLELVAGARESFRRVRSFVYIDRLAEADFELGHMVMTPALDLYARSDFGRVLAELWKRRAELLTRATLLVILGDGRNNRRAPRADLLREIGRVVRAVVWLNPEPRARWGTGDSAIELYAREVRALVPSPNLHELERALAHVA
jgi:uncharacterized protein with von Willebrand factor type A (vWA) domain